MGESVVLCLLLKVTGVLEAGPERGEEGGVLTQGCRV
jgi:hypothetical protein